MGRLKACAVQHTEQRSAVNYWHNPRLERRVLHARQRTNTLRAHHVSVCPSVALLHRVVTTNFGSHSCNNDLWLYCCNNDLGHRYYLWYQVVISFATLLTWWPVIWRNEHLWNSFVLQRLRLYELVCFMKPHVLKAVTVSILVVWTVLQCGLVGG